MSSCGQRTAWLGSPAARTSLEACRLVKDPYHTKVVVPAKTREYAHLQPLAMQGLLPLPQRTLLTARLVCQHWRDSLSQDISHLSLPYDAWGTFSSSSGSSSSSARLANHQAPEQTGWRSAATAAMAAVRQAAGNEEAEADATLAAPCRKQQGNRSSKGIKTATNTLDADADSGGGFGMDESCRTDDATQQQQQQQHQPLQSSDADMLDALGPPHLQQGPADTAAAGAAASKLEQQQQLHPLHQLPTSLPALTHITLNNRRSAWFNPQAACGAAAVAATVALLSQLPQLHTLTVQGYMTGTDWQPLLAEMAGPQHAQSEQQQQQLELGSCVEAAQETQQGSEVQQHGAQQQLVSNAQQLGLCTQLVCLDLQQLELPPPLLLESVLLRLVGLKSLKVHASIDSILEVREIRSQLCDVCGVLGGWVGGGSTISEWRTAGQYDGGAVV